MTEGIQIQITNLTGANVTIADVKDLTDFAGYATPGPIIIAPAGTETIPFTSRVAVSLEEGSLFTLLGLGSVSVDFLFAPRVNTGLGIPSSVYTATAGEDILLGNLLCLTSTDTVFKASQTTSLNRTEIFGVAQASVLTGNPVDVLITRGALIPVRFAIPLFASDNGKIVYLGTNGVGPLAPPSASGTSVVQVGVMEGSAALAVTPDVLFTPRHILDIL